MHSNIGRFGWFVGHLTLLFCAFRYGLSYITFNFYSRWARFSYRTAFVAAAATYGIVVYKAYRARARAGSRPYGGGLALASDENVQYLRKYIYLVEGIRLNLMTDDNNSHGSRVALWAPDTFGATSFHGLLCVPCRYIHSNKPYSHHFSTPTDRNAWSFSWGPPGNEDLPLGRYHWEVCQRVL